MTVPDLTSRLNQNATEYYQGYQSNDRERIREAVEKIGLDPLGNDALGNGSGRNVFDMSIFGKPDSVLKLAIPHEKWDGIKQNNRESKLWQIASSEQKKYLAPVLSQGPNGYWLIMEKGTSIQSIPYEWRADAKYYLDGLVWAEDITEENIVQIGGEPMLCDYGTPP